MHKIKVINNDWTTKKVAVINRTHPKTRTLKNGKVVPTWSAMCGEVAKI